MRRRDLLLSAMAPRGSLNLLDTAAAHVALAGKDKGRRKIWGRIGGTAAEHASAAELARQLGPFLPAVELEPFRFKAHRALEWEVRAGGKILETAMPAPFEARFPDRDVSAPVEPVDPDGDWRRVSGKWAFVNSLATTSTMLNVVREKLLYRRAVEHGAAGLLFAVPTPAGSRWKSVLPVDKPYALRDERYPGGLRPIPCFSMDSIDGTALASLSGERATAAIRYDSDGPHEGRNVVGFLPGTGAFAAGVMCHIDSFFTGACDNASGIAAMVGLAEALSRLPSRARKPDFYFLGLSAHHDEAAGMRDWVKRDPDRFRRVRQLFLLEHVDALPAPLNNNRIAYLGSDGWPEVRGVVDGLARKSGVMTVAPKMVDACIADLFVTCGRVKSFCLMNGPPFYHTDHDTLDRISERGIRNAVDFHWLLLKSLKLI